VYSSSLCEIAQKQRPVSFYVHVPFCEKLCHYCGCNKLVISRSHAEASDYAHRYLDSLFREIEWVNSHSSERIWNVHQIHWGGGTPTWLGPVEIERLWSKLTAKMNLAANAEISVEVDPRVTTTDQLKLLRDLGFNRVSMGVQDFDPSVQGAIQRFQPVEMVARLTEECRKLGIKGINYDLIYGLPLQTSESMERTLRQVVDLSPDRIAFYRLALLPDIFKWQRTFKESDLPSDQQVLEFMLRAMEVFGESGWDFIGLDHFAKHDDELSVAFRNHTLRRSFQGMTTGDELPVIGVGPSAISCLDDVFAQNEAKFPQWSNKVLSGGNATVRGHKMTEDDRVIRYVMGQLYCYREVDKRMFSEMSGFDFDVYFARSKHSWQEMEKLGFIENSHTTFRVRPLTGWLLMRVIAASFDSYLSADAWKTGISHGSRVG
jgi:oxygen-independent coproporphyrinogen-3 oxidase